MSIIERLKCRKAAIFGSADMKSNCTITWFNWNGKAVCSCVSQQMSIRKVIGSKTTLCVKPALASSVGTLHRFVHDHEFVSQDPQSIHFGTLVSIPRFTRERITLILTFRVIF